MRGGGEADTEDPSLDGDRPGEGDIFELFLDAEPTRKRVGVLVRAMYNRRLQGKERKLFGEFKASRNGAQIEVVIPRQRWKQAKRGKPEQKSMPGRQAVLTVRFQEVTVQSTRSDLRSKGGITLWGVYAREEHPPAGAKRVEWLLLTTERVETAQDAAHIVDLYTRRWRIEEWHHVLKSGCKVQEHQNETAERLMRVIAIDAVLAWRIQLMTLLGREVPELPCTVFFDEWEVKVLEALEWQKGKRGMKPPFNLGQAMSLVARQGGYWRAVPTRHLVPSASGRESYISTISLPDTNWPRSAPAPHPDKCPGGFVGQGQG